MVKEHALCLHLLLTIPVCPGNWKTEFYLGTWLIPLLIIGFLLLRTDGRMDPGQAINVLCHVEKLGMEVN